MKMNEGTGYSLANAITSTKNYGATNSRMLTVIDPKLITHTLQPTDTLQGLAVKYGVTVEKIKRVNKLWSNQYILAKTTLLIPVETPREYVEEEVKPASFSKPTTEYVKPETLDESDEIRTKRSDKKVKSAVNVELGSDGDGELVASLKEDDDEKEDNLKHFNEIMNKVDKTISIHKEELDLENCSEAFKAFNKILTKIDGEIESVKNKNGDIEPVGSLPVVGYDNAYQNSDLFSPIRQYPCLEQGT